MSAIEHLSKAKSSVKNPEIEDLIDQIIARLGSIGTKHIWEKLSGNEYRLVYGDLLFYAKMWRTEYWTGSIVVEDPHGKQIDVLIIKGGLKTLADIEEIFLTYIERKYNTKNETNYF